MVQQTELFKGELMEELLRKYFLNNGYFVARGIKYAFEGNEITDIDLFLYGRVSGLTRERTNVDIKNKKTPKAFERILWAKGLQQLLNFDNCIVATTDKKDSVRSYGHKHSIIILDGNFLQKLSYKNPDRMSEEEFMRTLNQYKSFSDFKNQSWKNLYEQSKSRLLSELDFSGFNSTLILLKYFTKNCFDKQKKEVALRAAYAVLSHCLIILDFILKDIAFLDPDQRKSALSDGFKYGNLGQDGVNRTIGLALRIANSEMSISQIKKSLDETEMDILKEYFSKADTIKNVFRWAIALEHYAFSKELMYPDGLDPELKGTLSIMLDFFQINRKGFFNNYAS